MSSGRLASAPLQHQEPAIPYIDMTTKAIKPLVKRMVNQLRIPRTAAALNAPTGILLLWLLQNDFV